MYNPRVSADAPDTPVPEPSAHGVGWKVSFQVVQKRGAPHRSPAVAGTLWLCIAATMGCAIVSRFPSDCSVRESAPRATYLAEIKRDLQEAWPDNRTITIVCHGHSVPAGYFETPTVDSLHAYPHLLLTKLKQHYPNAVINVIVTAIGGENAVSGAARFQRDVLPHHPDVVTIDYALNDRGNGLERSRMAWEQMIASARAHGVKVILLTPTPDQQSDLADPDDPLYQHARQVRELAALHQVGLVDSLALFQQRIQEGIRLGDLMAQVNHPNSAGHELVAEGLMEWFEQEDPPAGEE